MGCEMQISAIQKAWLMLSSSKKKVNRFGHDGPNSIGGVVRVACKAQGR